MVSSGREFGYLQGVAFIGNFKAISKRKNTFDVGLKQICFKNNSSNSYGQGFMRVENFCLLMKM